MKKYTISLATLALAILCVISYQIIGSEISADGTLIEPFFLIPMGYLFLLISLISSITITFLKFRKIRNS